MENQWIQSISHTKSHEPQSKSHYIMMFLVLHGFAPLSRGEYFHMDLDVWRGLLIWTWSYLKIWNQWCVLCFQAKPFHPNHIGTMCGCVFHTGAVQRMFVTSFIFMFWCLHPSNRRKMSPAYLFFKTTMTTNTKREARPYSNRTKTFKKKKKKKQTKKKMVVFFSSTTTNKEAHYK